MLSATINVGVPDVPQWIFSALIAITRGWYDPKRADRTEKRTNGAVDDAAGVRNRAEQVIETYAREDSIRRPRHP